MSFSSRRRNYLLTPHRRDGLIEWMKSMLMHSFVLDALDTTGADTFSHFEILIDEHRKMANQFLSDLSHTNNLNNAVNAVSSSIAINAASHAQPHSMIVPSRLKQLVPTVGTFYTRLPLRKAFEAYNAKYGITKRRHICISFNEIRHILNLAQIIAMTDSSPEGGSEERYSSLSLAALSVKNIEEDPSAPRLSAEINGSKTTAMSTPLMNERKERQSEKDARALEAWTETPRTWTLDDASITPTNSPKPSRQLIGSNDNDEDETSKGQQSPNKTLKRERSESFAIEESLSNRTTICGPKLLCFDGDQTLYSDGANFESNPKLAKYLYLLLKHGVTIAVVTAAGYEYQAEKYELRLSGLLAYFKERGLEGEDLERFYIFGGECNYLLRLGEDYKLKAVREYGPGGWLVSTKHISESPGNWSENDITAVLDRVEASFQSSIDDQNMRARIIRKKRSVGLIPKADEKIPREALDEAVLRIQTELDEWKVTLPFCAFNGGRDAWVDVGNKRVGVQVLQSYLGIPPEETLHIGDQFLNTGNDFAARSVCPCVWITSPEETTYILKSILRLAGVPLMALMNPSKEAGGIKSKEAAGKGEKDGKKVDFDEMERRSSCVMMDVYTGEMIHKKMVA